MAPNITTLELPNMRAQEKDDIVNVARALTEEEELYKENIMDHYQHPRNKLKLERYTCSHREFNPLCGDEITIFVSIKKEAIDNISFQGNGCAISQAAASMLTDFIKEKSIEEIKRLGPWDVFNLLGIRISHTRSKCALLCLKAVQSGLRKTEGTV